MFGIDLTQLSTVMSKVDEFVKVTLSIIQAIQATQERQGRAIEAQNKALAKIAEKLGVEDDNHNGIPDALEEKTNG